MTARGIFNSIPSWMPSLVLTLAIAVGGTYIGVQTGLATAQARIERNAEAIGKLDNGKLSKERYDSDQANLKEYIRTQFEDVKTAIRELNKQQIEEIRRTR